MVKLRTDDFKHFDSKSNWLLKFQLQLNCRELQSLPETGRKPYNGMFIFILGGDIKLDLSPCLQFRVNK